MLIMLPPTHMQEQKTRAITYLVVLRLFALAFFIFSVVRVDGLSNHNNFSTSAAILAMGDYGGDRNRVEG